MRRALLHVAILCAFASASLAGDRPQVITAPYAEAVVRAVLDGPHRNADLQLPPMEQMARGLYGDEILFKRICRPQFDLVVSARRMSDVEQKRCADNNVTVAEIPWVRGRITKGEGVGTKLSVFLYVGKTRIAALPQFKKMIEALVADDVAGPNGFFAKITPDHFAKSPPDAFEIELTPLDKATLAKAQAIAKSL